MVLIDNTHRVGRHCGSSGIRDLVEHHGTVLSEAMCFGIGAGLGLWRISPQSPSRMVHLRNHDLEEQFFERLGTPFAWQTFDDPARSEAALKQALDQGLPALLQTDIYHLPYYGSSTHFPGHVVVAWGYDDDRGVFIVSDTERPGLQEVPFEKMCLSRHTGGTMYQVKGNMFAPSAVALTGEVPDLLMPAAAFCSARMLEGLGDIGGLPGLEAWQAELPRWAELEDWRWCARFAYQIIEKRGTGGGAFRLMYADFLDEAAEMLPEVGQRGLPQMMRRVAGLWTALSDAFKDVSEAPEPDFGPVREPMAAVLAAEREYHREAAAALGT